MHVFWQQRYEGASIPDLASAMGISVQSLYAAFGSKSGLYREVIDHYRATIGGFGTRALAEEHDVFASLRRMLDEAAVLFASSATPGCMITMAPAGPGDDELTCLGRSLRAENQAAIADRLLGAQQDGQILASADCTAWARYLANVIHGLSVQARDGATLEELRGVTEIALAACSQLGRSAARNEA